MGDFTTILIDTPMYLQGADGGPVVGPVGFLRKGANVHAVSVSDQPDYAEVETSFPASLSPVVSDADLAKTGGYLLAKFGLSVLVPRKTVPRIWSRMGDVDSLDWGYYRPLHLRPGGFQFSLLLCGRVRELERHNGYVFLAAEFPTGELWGWMSQRPDYPDHPSEKGDDISCMHPVPEGKPADYLYPSTAKFEQTPLGKRMVVADEFFRVRRSDSDPTRLECQGVRLAQDTKAKGKLLQYLAKDGSIERTRHLSIWDDRVYVGLSQLEPDGSVISASGGVGTHLRAVREDGSSIGFVYFGTHEEEHESRVRYFHPTAVEWWDRTAERCHSRLELLQAAWGSELE